MALRSILIACLVLGIICCTSAQPDPPPLHQAVLDNNVDRARRLLEAHPDMVNERDPVVMVPPLYPACAEGHVVMVQLLLSHGADVQLATEDGSTPLHAAAFGGHFDIVKMLVDGGAEVGAVNMQGYTALDAATYGGHTEIMNFLRDHEEAEKAEKAKTDSTEEL